MRLLLASWLLGFLASAALAQPDSLHILWDRSGDGEQSYFGVKIVPLGDQNDDGYADFAVWAGGTGQPGQASEEKLQFFHGGNPASQEPYLTFRGDSVTGSNIRYFSVVGDVNGDGHEDWEVWWQFASDPNNYVFHIYLGGPDADTIPDVSLYGPFNEDVFPVGDFNGDGFADLYVYRASGDYGQILFGGNPMDTVPDWTRHSPEGHPYEALPQTFRNVGRNDLNGDGFADFVSGSGTTAYVYLGGITVDTLPAYTWSNTYSWPSEIISSLNGDNYDDIVFHGLRVCFGRDSLRSAPDYVLNFYGNCSPLWKFSLGDINGDSHGDMAVIDDGCNNLWGTLAVYLGHPWLNPDPAFVVQGRTAPLFLIGIRTAAGLGDVNGDGIDDWALGAANTNFDGTRGRVVVIAGDTTLHVSTSPSWPEIPQALEVTAYPNPFNSACTISLSLPTYRSEAVLTLINVLGQQVRLVTLHNVAGEIRYSLDGSGLATGLYLLQVKAGSLSTTTKLMVLK